MSITNDFFDVFYQPGENPVSATEADQPYTKKAL